MRNQRATRILLLQVIAALLFGCQSSESPPITKSMAVTTVLNSDKLNNLTVIGPNESKGGVDSGSIIIGNKYKSTPLTTSSHSEQGLRPTIIVAPHASDKRADLDSIIIGQNSSAPAPATNPISKQSPLESNPIIAVLPHDNSTSAIPEQTTVNSSSSLVVTPNAAESKSSVAPSLYSEQELRPTLMVAAHASDKRADLDSIIIGRNSSAPAPATNPISKQSPLESNPIIAVLPHDNSTSAIPEQTTVNSSSSLVITPTVAESKSSVAPAVACELTALLILLVTWRYYVSESARIRRKMKIIQTDLECILSDYKNYSEELKNEVIAASNNYKTIIRNNYLQSISLDEIKRNAHGARIAPLRNHGISTLLDCHSWGASDFASLHGIGPDSANRIKAACAFLSKRVLQQPIIHPIVSDPSGLGKDLFQAIYRQRRGNESLLAVRTKLRSNYEVLLPQLSEIQSATSFFRWLFGSEKVNPLRAAIGAGKKIENSMSAGAVNALLLEEARGNLGKALQTACQICSTSQLATDVANQPDFYRDTFGELLGKGIPVSSVASPSKLETPHKDIAEPVSLKLPDETGSTHTIPPSFEELLGKDIPVSSVASPSKLETPHKDIAEPVSVKLPDETGSAYTIPRSTDLRKDQDDVTTSQTIVTSEGCWIPPGRVVTVKGYEIKDGLIYVGRNLLSISGGALEPALIDPSLPVNPAKANYRVRSFISTSKYNYADATARASYLQWLATGRNDPEADEGNVLLYFYGLERRALAESSDETELALIFKEVERLLSIYTKHWDFMGYANEFLNYLGAVQAPNLGDVLDDEPPPFVRFNNPLNPFNLPFNLRKKLGLFAVTSEPLPAKWAYAWYYRDPRSRLPTVAGRCHEQVCSLFAVIYNQQYRDGLILPPNKTPLKVTYRPASSSFGKALVKATELPDVTVLSAPYAKIEAVARETFEQLDAYSRYLGRNSNSSTSLDARLLLPVPLWPEALRMTVQDRAHALVDDAVAKPLLLSELLKPLEVTSSLNRAQYSAFTRGLATAGVGIEPDLKFAKEVPKLEDSVALFPLEKAGGPSADYGLCALIVQLGCLVAHASGGISGNESDKIRSYIEKSEGLEVNDKRRLLARMTTHRLNPPSIAGLRTTVEKLTPETRSEIVDFLLTIVCADDRVEPEEVRVMENIYTLLGLEKAPLYSRLHGLSANSELSAPTHRKNVGPVNLDRAKIAQLKADSDEVGRKLAAIFAEEAITAYIPTPHDASKISSTVGPAGLNQLDPAHAGLLTVVLERSQWTRAEFTQLCKERGLMADGAIESINEASFSQFDEPMIEGEDLLVISAHLLKG